MNQIQPGFCEDIAWSVPSERSSDPSVVSGQRIDFQKLGLTQHWEIRIATSLPAQISVAKFFSTYCDLHRQVQNVSLYLSLFSSIVRPFRSFESIHRKRAVGKLTQSSIDRGLDWRFTIIEDSRSSLLTEMQKVLPGFHREHKHTLDTPYAVD